MIEFQNRSSFVLCRHSPFKFSSGAEGLLGCIAKQNYNFWIKQDYLGKEERLAALDLVCFRLSVFRGMAFDRICYHPVIFGKPHIFYHLVELFSCPSVKWNSGFVFTFSWGLSYEEYFRVARSLPNYPFYRTFMKWAACAFNYLSSDSCISCFHHHSYSFFEVSAVIFFICRRILPPLISNPVVRYILQLYGSFLLLAFI